MELLVATIGEYSFVVAPALVTWAIASLYIQAYGSTSAYSQTVFFVTLLAIGILTMRSMVLSEQHWLIHAVSLGVLIVAGALRRPVENPSTAWTIS